MQSDISNEIVRYVRERSIQLGLPPYHIVNHEGLLRFLVIRDAKFTGEVLVNFVTGTGDFEGIDILAMELGKRFEEVVSVSHTVNAAKANIAKGDKERIIYGADHIHEVLGNKKFRISANSFFQTNSYQAQRLYDAAVELAQPEGNEKMLDLYTGTGTIAIYFADMVESVKGVENVADAVADARINAKLNGISNVDFHVGDVEEFMKEAAANDSKSDLVVLDPPRAGLHPKTLKYLQVMQPGKIVYISCNPATLARDLKSLMENGFALDKVIPLDLFPHTFHIEAACRLTFSG